MRLYTNYVPGKCYYECNENVTPQSHDSIFKNAFQTVLNHVSLTSKKHEAAILVATVEKGAKNGHVICVRPLLEGHTNKMYRIQ